MNIDEKVYKLIVSQARDEFPLECCGYLAGKKERVTTAHPMENMDKSEIHYSFNPEEQFKTIKNIRKESLEVLAVYHSHPESPARPSAEDIKLAYDSEISYVIISLQDEKETVKSFRIRDGQVQEEELTIR